MRKALKTVLGSVGALGAVFVLAPSAWAHVTVSAVGATRGGSDQLITFRVPTESATASTTKLAVQLPTATPIASVLVAPHVGWTDHVTTVKLAKPIQTDDGPITTAVSEISWNANSPSDGIKPGQFDQFVIIAGQLPETGSLTFPAIQTYSDGSVVSWNQVAAPGSSDEPDHPAPVLDLAATGATSDNSTGSTAPTVTHTASGSSDTASTSSAVTGIVLGALGVVLGAVALGLAVQQRRRSAP